MGSEKVATTEGRLVAMGGGGFSMEPDNPLLDDFVLSLARRDRPRVCFVPTASGDSTPYIARFYRAFVGRCEPFDLTLLDSGSLPRRPRRTADLAAFVAEQDVFYVGGGNTANLLAVWRTHGLDRLLMQAWRSGVVLAGISAVMICWSQASLTDSFGGLEPLNDGLGLLDGSACPHYDGEPGRREAYHRMVSRGAPSGYAADDGAALYFIGRRLQEVVSSRPNASAYRVEWRDGQVIEERLPVRYLGTGSPGA